MQRLAFSETGDDNNSRHVETCEEKILFALTAQERDQFFPSQDLAAIGAMECLSVDACSIPSPDWWSSLLQEIRPTILVSCWGTPMVPYPLVASGLVPLRYVCHASGSVRKVVPREFITNGGVVTNWAGLVGNSVAEHALLLILASLRNLPQWHLALGEDMNKRWGKGPQMGTLSLRGRNVGIHGFGNIARELARLLKPFEVNCRAYSEGVPAEIMRQHGVAPCNSLEELFANSDVLAECESLTPKSVGIVNADILKLMPKGGVFVNVARGAIVDQAALDCLARNGHIRVASDVFREEPLPQNSPLRTNPNVLISPHIGGPTADCYPRCGEFALKNISRYLAGEPLEGRITLEIFDRST